MCGANLGLLWFGRAASVEDCRRDVRRCDGCSSALKVRREGWMYIAPTLLFIAPLALVHRTTGVSLEVAVLPALVLSWVVTWLVLGRLTRFERAE